jgi:hypothetical protein
MLRFSDRLTSTSSAPLELVKAAPADTGVSDEARKADKGETMTTKDTEYNAFVGLLGLHQTINVLEAEYGVVTAADGRATEARQGENE